MLDVRGSYSEYTRTLVTRSSWISQSCIVTEIPGQTLQTSGDVISPRCWQVSSNWARSLIPATRRAVVARATLIPWKSKHKDWMFAVACMWVKSCHISAQNTKQILIRQQKFKPVKKYTLKQFTLS